MKKTPVKPKPPAEPIVAAQIRININVSEAERKRWKKAAIDADLTMSDLMRAAMKAFLAEPF